MYLTLFYYPGYSVLVSKTPKSTYLGFLLFYTGQEPREGKTKCHLVRRKVGIYADHFVVYVQVKRREVKKRRSVKSALFLPLLHRPHNYET